MHNYLRGTLLLSQRYYVPISEVLQAYLKGTSYLSQRYFTLNGTSHNLDNQYVKEVLIVNK
jgi:hypothetical protein